ncbi:hypothetical protein KR084_000645 [Drosophila pseudotakahashii]|nr:hypothetical protein KR084_000645 [Drosophila pseudotakahashii]
MFKFKMNFLFIFAVCILFELAQSQNSVCVLQDPSLQCGSFCLSSMHPLYDQYAHIKHHMKIQSANINATLTIQNEIQDKINGIDIQESCQQCRKPILDQLQVMQGKLDALSATIASKQDKLESQQAELLKKLIRLDKKIVPPQFELIGSRFFYIEKEIRKNWYSAGDTCRQMGAQLAVIQSEEELTALKAKLHKDRIYWLDINDLDKEGQFKSSASGKQAPFFKWRAGQPNNFDENQHCVDLLDGLMYDNKCKSLSYFICQSDNDSLN